MMLNKGPDGDGVVDWEGGNMDVMTFVCIYTGAPGATHYRVFPQPPRGIPLAVMPVSPDALTVK